MVTHSPNIAVVCDSEQLIHASIDRADRNRVTYMSGSIESPDMNKFLVDVLEGTRPALTTEIPNTIGTNLGRERLR